MRALLVVNPAATTTSARTRDVLIHALASEMKLEAVTTEYRGHARDLGRQAAESDDVDLIITLGGDGTINEVVNGLLHDGPDPDRLPRLAVVPGGSTNVFARWFTFNAGLGFDAGVVGRVEQHRERGKRSTHSLYMRQAFRQFLGETHRRRGTITLERPGADPVTDLVLSIVCNTSPWTYLGNRPVYASPKASFDKGLDVLGLSRMSTAAVARYGTQLLTSSPERGPHGKHAVSLHDQTDFTLHSKAPLPLQMDGDHLGLRTSVTFTGVRRALRVIV